MHLHWSRMQSPCQLKASYVSLSSWCDHCLWKCVTAGGFASRATDCHKEDTKDVFRQIGQLRRLSYHGLINIKVVWVVHDVVVVNGSINSRCIRCRTYRIRKMWPWLKPSVTFVARWNRASQGTLSARHVGIIVISCEASSDLHEDTAKSGLLMDSEIGFQNVFLGLTNANEVLQSAQLFPDGLVCHKPWPLQFDEKYHQQFYNTWATRWGNYLKATCSTGHISKTQTLNLRNLHDYGQSRQSSQNLYSLQP